MKSITLTPYFWWQKIIVTLVFKAATNFFSKILIITLFPVVEFQLRFLLNGMTARQMLKLDMKIIGISIAQCQRPQLSRREWANPFSSGKVNSPILIYFWQKGGNFSHSLICPKVPIFQYALNAILCFSPVRKWIPPWLPTSTRLIKTHLNQNSPKSKLT
jgi:hypothetical protein